MSKSCSQSHLTVLSKEYNKTHDLLYAALLLEI